MQTEYELIIFIFVVPPLVGRTDFCGRILIPPSTVVQRRPVSELRVKPLICNRVEPSLVDYVVLVSVTLRIKKACLHRQQAGGYCVPPAVIPLRFDWVVRFYIVWVHETPNTFPCSYQTKKTEYNSVDLSSLELCN